jgi:hypothetical protein
MKIVLPASFTDVASRAGLHAVIVAGGQPQKYIVESIGSGVAFLDYDNDGDLDLLFLAPVDKEAMIAPLQKAADTGLPMSSGPFGQLYVQSMSL